MTAARLDNNMAREVAEQVEELFGLTKSATLFANQTGNVVSARRLAWYVLYVRWNFGYSQLEKIWGYDHTTIREGVIAICDSLKHDRDLQQKARVLGV